MEDGLDKWDGARIAASRPAIEAGLLALGVPPREVRDAGQTVSDAVVRALCDDRGRWILRRRQIDACEYALAVPMDAAVHHAAVDRTFVEDGIRWIVDYKTSSHEDAGLNGFLEKERSRYKDQLQRYARLFSRFENLPVRLGLYLPPVGRVARMGRRVRRVPAHFAGLILAAPGNSKDQMAVGLRDRNTPSRGRIPSIRRCTSTPTHARLKRSNFRKEPRPCP